MVLRPSRSRCACGGLSERIVVIDPDLQLPVEHGGEQLVRAPDQFFARQHVMRKAGPREEQRTFLIEDRRIEWRNRSAGLTEQRHRTARTQRVEAFLECRDANGVVDDIDAFVVGQPFCFCFEVLLRVEDYFVGAGLARQLGLCLRRYRADDARAGSLSELRNQQPAPPAAACTRAVSPFFRGKVDRVK